MACHMITATAFAINNDIHNNHHETDACGEDNCDKYGTAQRQLDARTWVASWPTTGGSAESVQTGMGACQHP